MKRIILLIILLSTLAILISCEDKPRWDFEKQSWSPFFKSIYNEEIDKINKYIENGSDVNERNKEGLTPLEVAINNQKYYSVKVLLENGANVNLEGRDGSKPIIIACLKENVEIVKLLVSYGANINDKRLGNGWTPLMSATSHGSYEILVYLIDQGADLDAQVRGDTALMLAIYKGNYEKAKALVEAGADITLKNSEGDTASDINRKYNSKNTQLFNKINELLNNEDIR